jgi:mediator of RNA polymerase II transcription subunit 12, fungi type
MLDRSNDAESMHGLIGTFYRYATIWTCMDVVPIIVQALDRAHQVWKHICGVQSRPLLALLIKFDNGRYLDEGSRQTIESDIAAFTLVTPFHYPNR